jgi:ADP-ribose pyrophosphatase YjhB (NUDIX family)
MPSTLLVGQKGFIVNGKSQVLIIKHSETINPNEYWDLPGGKMALGLSLRDSLTRQVWEEIGLTVTVVSVPLNITTFTKGDDATIQVLRVIYLCRAEGNVSTSKNVVEFLWIDPNDHKLYTFPDKAYSQAFETYLTHSELASEEFLGPGILSTSADMLRSGTNS